MIKKLKIKTFLSQEALTPPILIVWKFKWNITVMMLTMSLMCKRSGNRTHVQSQYISVSLDFLRFSVVNYSRVLLLFVNHYQNLNPIRNHKFVHDARLEIGRASCRERV